MLENDIAETSTSAWSSACILVGKPDTTFPFCPFAQFDLLKEYW